MPRGKGRRTLELIEASTEILEEIQPCSVRALCYRLFTLDIPAWNRYVGCRAAGAGLDHRDCAGVEQYLEAGIGILRGGVLSVSAGAIKAALRCGAPRCVCARPRGPLHCPAHVDKHPSFDVTERAARLLFVCRSGCSQADVIEALRARGLWADGQRSIPVRTRSPREKTLAEAQRRLDRLVPHLAVYEQADEIRHDHRLVAAVRQVATQLGDTELSWDLLEAAADLERAAWLTEARLDG
jgi:hypothetical protein